MKVSFRGLTRSIPKALKKQLEKDGWMMLMFSVAKELRMTVQRLREEMTPIELIGWSCFFEIQNEHQEQQMKQARRGRRR